MGCGWSDNGRVEQGSGIIGSDAHPQVADEKEDVVISVFRAEWCFSVPYTPRLMVGTYSTVVDHHSSSTVELELSV
eukprot:scaffold10655_cov51-Cyclotella_meneghiniana.AAC.5